ncbi:MAG: 30S ribosomal protein S12 methylthiotransferase RimO [Epsilonproteobacteria bacterium]|nr:30S ribosomal protein S12 methylthiotransferase RimO [Campylobacterota bacterium]
MKKAFQEISTLDSKTRLYIISLGCPKNRVDSEYIASNFAHSEINIVDKPDKADLIMINSCGFIEEAVSESIDEVLSAIEIKKKTGAKLLVAGCMVSRYKGKIEDQIPEVDFWFDTKDMLIEKTADRLVSTFPYGYIKIADGCDHKCSFCTIPSFKGNFKSISEDTVLSQVHLLLSKKIKELIIVAQDCSYYGRDNSTSLSSLLKKIDDIDGKFWIRPLYLYPTEITDELIDTIAGSEKILPYFDMPVQHASSQLLADMKRGYDKQDIINIVSKIRSKITNAAFRGTLIVGYPGEKESDIIELKQFLDEIKFDNIGVFTYSDENDLETDKNRIAKPVKEARMADIMRHQQKRSHMINKKFVGKVVSCLADNQNIARDYRMSPQIDGKIHSSGMTAGKFYNIRIQKADIYDLYGTVI